MWIPIFLFIVGLVLLVKGGDWFVDGATGIAQRSHLPELLIGATVVSIGTTLPEVMVSASSAVLGHGEIAYGNAIGSVICNTALIAALTVAIRPGDVDRKSLRTPTLFFFAAAAVYMLTAYFYSFTRLIGILLLLMFVVYMVVTVRQLQAPASLGAAEEQSAAEEAPSGKAWKDVVLLVVGAALIAFGSKLLVDNGTKIAEWLGVPESVIALTFVALGTSLPELMTAITALIKGHSALSLGNIVGANLFNLVLVSGVSVTLSPFPLPQEKTLAGMNASLVLDLPLMVCVMALLTLPALKKGKLGRWQGIVLLAVYAAFCVFQFAV